MDEMSQHYRNFFILEHMEKQGPLSVMLMVPHRAMSVRPQKSPYLCKMRWRLEQMAVPPTECLVPLALSKHDVPCNLYLYPQRSPELQ